MSVRVPSVPGAFTVRAKAIHSRSRDHAGDLSSSGPQVRTDSPVPSGLMTWMWKRPPRRLANTIRPSRPALFGVLGVTGAGREGLEDRPALTARPGDSIRTESVAATAAPDTATAKPHMSRRRPPRSDGTLVLRVGEHRQHGPFVGRRPEDFLGVGLHGVVHADVSSRLLRQEPSMLEQLMEN